MARKQTRVILNRQRFAGVMLAVADGLFEVGRTVLDTANIPDAPPYGEGLVRNNGVVAQVDGKKVAGWGADGREPKPPRSVRPLKDGVTVTVGFGFPATFAHNGTVDTRANPFLIVAREEVVARAAEIARPLVGARLKAIR